MVLRFSPVSPLLSTVFLALTAHQCGGTSVWWHSHHKSLRSSAFSDTSYCTKLVNHGTHSTVDIEVGTPGQKFSVVADTGSDAVIIPSCICQHKGACSKEERCFTGTNRSSTFEIDDDPQPQLLYFGSGTIEAVDIKDVVRLGNLRVSMNETGLMLMTNRYLNFGGTFEGILGLGPPLPPEEEEPLLSKNEAETDSDSMASMRDAFKKIMDGILGGNASTDIGDGGQIKNDIDSQVLLKTDHAPVFAAEYNKQNDSRVKGLFEQATIDRFSLCLNDGPDGVLRFNLPEMSGGINSIGTKHWGLNLTGVSVGNVTAPILLCNSTGMEDGQTTPCAAIPDSGTTNIMAPADQVESLFNTICDNWPRCAQNYTAFLNAAEAAKKKAVDIYNIDPFDISHSALSKSDILGLLLLDCESWMNASGDFDELPSIHLHLGGSSENQTLELPAYYYIMESETQDYDYVFKHLEDLGNSGMPNSTKSRKVCTPAISPFEYSTTENGPVWILGTPIFYGYTVGYDRRDPPKVSFTSTHETPCGSCQSSTGFFSTHDTRAQRRPRMAKWPARRPSINVKEPL